MLDPGCKNHQLNDNVPKGLVKPVDMMCGEVNKSDDKLDETLTVADDKLDETIAVVVIVDCSMLRASAPTNAMEYQEPKPTDKVNAEFSVYIQVDHVQCKDQPLVDTMSIEDNISEYKLDETVAAGVIFNLSTYQASPPLNAMQYQERHPTDKVDAAVFVDVQLDHVQSLKNLSLIDNVK
ncbi:hypothetical protein Tco_0911988, partial [Tanacetum coccineum]